jgi:hypothetical protein
MRRRRHLRKEDAQCRQVEEHAERQQGQAIDREVRLVHRFGGREADRAEPIHDIPFRPLAAKDGAGEEQGEVVEDFPAALSEGLAPLEHQLLVGHLALLRTQACGQGERGVGAVQEGRHTLVELREFVGGLREEPCIPRFASQLLDAVI